MTYYQLKNPPGCVVHEFRAWTKSDGVPLRLALDAVHNIHMNMDTGEMQVTDVAGYLHVVGSTDYVAEHTTNPRRLSVYSAEEFEAQFKVSDRA